MNSASITKAPERQLRVLVADDHQIVRVGIKALLTIRKDMEVIAEASNGIETLEMAERHRPDVVLLDMRMPEIDGLAVCRQLKSKHPLMAVLFLTSYGDDKTILGAIEAGADGYLLKAIADQDIPSAIITVCSGGSVLNPVVTRRLLKSVHAPCKTALESNTTAQSETSLRAKTTPQEARVLDQVAMGKSNKQVAHELRLSEGTVRNYLSSAFTKLGVVSRVEAAVLWLSAE